MKASVKELLGKYEAYSVKIKELQEKQKDIRKPIDAYVLRHGKVQYNGISCFIVTKRIIEYDIPAIEENVEKEMCRRFIDDTVTMNTNDFIRICKRNGVSPKAFARIMDRKKQVNEDKLGKLVESGELAIDDLEGCYQSKESKTVSIRVGQ